MNIAILAFVFAATASLGAAQTAPARSGEAVRPIPQATPARDLPAAAPTGTSAIRGRVVAAETGRPLALATITASAPELREPRSISTNREGRYELRNLPAGRYTLSISRSGYLPLKYGQRRPLEQGKLLQLAAAQVADNVDFVMPRMSVISGRILDDQGEPMAGAIITARQVLFNSGRVPSFPVGFGDARTDASGQYRIIGLTPGEYVVAAQAFDSWKVDAQRSMGYTITYYPGSSRPSEARRVSVGVGQEAPDVDFPLAPGRMATVTGTIRNSRGRPVTTPFVILSQSIPGPYGGLSRGMAGTERPAVGTFSIRDVLPGEYTLKIGVPPDPASGQPAESAVTTVVVDNADVNVDVTTSTGWSIAGRIVADGGGAPPAKQNQFSAMAFPPTQDLGPVFMGIDPRSNGDNGRVRDDWSFAINGLFGPMRLIPRVPDGWTITSIMSEGRDISGAILEREGGTLLSGVQVVVSNRPAAINGQVTDANGSPTTEGTVIVFATDRGRWFGNSPFVRAARPDQSGRYEIKGLPPGDYLAVAMDYVPDRIWNDPDYLESVRQYAQKITLEAGTSKAMPLRLAIP